MLVFFCHIWPDLCIPITATAMQFGTHSATKYPFSEQLQRGNWNSSDCFVVLAFLQNKWLSREALTGAQGCRQPSVLPPRPPITLPPSPSCPAWQVTAPGGSGAGMQQSCSADASKLAADLNPEKAQSSRFQSSLAGQACASSDPWACDC